MRLTLIRHGEAGDDAPRDEARALTKKGRADVRRVGRGLIRVGLRCDAMVASALVRAVQTAEIVAAAIDYRGQIIISDLLVPEAPPAGVVGLLTTLGNLGNTSVVLVAHEPILSGVAALLSGAAHFPPLRKAEVIRLRLPEGPGVAGSFRWRIDPDSGKRRRE